MKKVLMKNAVYVLCLLVLLSAVGCGPSMKKSETEQTYYTKYNFHYTMEKGKIRGSIANYTNLPEHRILPYGSAVTVKPGGQGFIMTDVKSGKRIRKLSLHF